MQLEADALEGLDDLGLFKMAKRILRGEIEYEKKRPDADEICDGDTNEPCCRLWGLTNLKHLRSIEVVDPSEVSIHTLAAAGFFAFEAGYGVRMAIFNCDELHSDVLDESEVKGLLLGPRVSRIRNDILSAGFLRYIHVAKENAHFMTENHVLYSKDQKRLIRYAPARPEEDFRVPSTVRELSNCAFLAAWNLKRLYLPRRIRMQRTDSHLGWAYIPASTEISYYDP